MLITFAVIAILSTIAYQDFKSRSVQWFLFPVLFVACIYFKVTHLSVVEWADIIGNVFATLVIFSLLFFYLKVIRKSGLRSSLENYIGIGDIVFYLSITPLFPVVTYLLFFVSSSIVTLFLATIWFLFKRNNKILIPFAGIVAIFTAILLIYNNFADSPKILDEYFVLRLMMDD